MIKDDELNILIFCAFRYALGRRSYIVGFVSEILQKHIGKIDSGNRELITKEINKAIEGGHAGMKCDIAEWNKLLQVLMDEQSTEISSETQP
jgi:hypothetical protein